MLFPRVRILIVVGLVAASSVAEQRSATGDASAGRDAADRSVSPSEKEASPTRPPAGSSEQPAGDTTNSRASEPDAGVREPLVVEWTGPGACGANDALEREVVRLLGELSKTADVLVQARGSVLGDGRYRIDLNLQGAVHGERSLESRKCSEALQAAAVVVALAINSDVLLVADEPEPEPTPPPIAAPPHPPPVVPATASQEHELLVFVSPRARLSGGLSPFPHFGVDLRAGLEHGFLRGFLSGFAEPTTRHALVPVGYYSLRTLGGALGACARIPTTDALDVRLCASLSLSHLKVSASELATNRQQEAWILAPQAGLELGVPMNRHVALVAGSELALPTTYPTFIVNGPGNSTTSAHDVSLGGVFTVGLELSL